MEKDVEKDMEQDVAAFARLLSKESKKGFRRYELRKIDGRLMLVRNEIDRFFDIAVSEVFGAELEPDDRMECSWTRPDPNAYVATAAAFLTGDRVLEDLGIEERLDAAVDRAMKRLYQLKMARQLDHPRLPSLIDKAPMQLAGPDTVLNKVAE